MEGGNLRYQFARLSIAEKLVVVNVAAFLVLRLLVFLMQWPGGGPEAWLVLPKDFGTFLTRPWTLVTYSFLHGGLWHLLGNMLGIYYVGRIFLNYFGPRRFTNVYFLGVITGGLFFLTAYNLFPAFYGSQSVLLGASAGLLAILVYVCTFAPNQEVRVFFFNLKLWYIGAFFVLMDLALIPLGDNPGGRLAHLGGALLGYLYASRARQGGDLGAGFSKLLDGVANLFKKRVKKAPMKTVYRRTPGGATSGVDYEKETRQRKIDGILDKISKSGYESLTQAEKDFLFKAGKDNG